MIEVRCRKCNTLLCKESIRDGCIEIKCSRCNTFNIVDRIITDTNTLDRKRKRTYNDYKSF
jgi:phage FluMu protein Com